MPARTGPDHRARPVMTSDKVRPHHLERKALLYVRQSSAHQVLHNRESGALQYAMRDRLAALGWSEIEVIDDDLGRSAAGRVQRAGFERMVGQVCLGKVGAVCAREVSRFARNSRDWQQLIEMCRVVDTVLIDEETIYAPRHGNDRLLLGLKGSLNEYELDLLRQRSLSARYEKARRGELVVGAPAGFVKAGDHYEKDPDRRVLMVRRPWRQATASPARRRAGRHVPIGWRSCRTPMKAISAGKRPRRFARWSAATCQPAAIMARPSMATPFYRGSSAAAVAVES